MTTKQVILVRHGESLGQTAKRRGMSRKDPSLIDCFLSPRGVNQAYALDNQFGEGADLVCVSPLTRAVATCILGVRSLPADIPIVCHPLLAETGSKIPENTARPLKEVIRHIKWEIYEPSALDALSRIDWSLLPEDWPNELPHVAPFLTWLASRPEKRVLVVCHHNVILCHLRYTIPGCSNADPIHCVLTESGILNPTSRPPATVDRTPPPVAPAVRSNKYIRSNNKSIRLGLCSKLEQRKPSAVVFIQPVVNDILEHARRKFRWKAKKTADQKYTIRRSADGRQVTVSLGDTMRLDWLQDGDTIYVGPSLVDTTNAKFPSPPRLERRGENVNAQRMIPSVSQDVVSDSVPGKRPARKGHNQCHFPTLEGNVLKQVRNAIDNHVSFVERRTDLDATSSFIAVDYEELTRDALPDPCENGISRSEQRRRLLRRECRGLLLDSKTGKVLARRLHKFWSVGEREEVAMDRLPPLCENCILTDKIDGTLVTPILNGDQLVWASKRTVFPAVNDFISQEIEAFGRHCIQQLSATPIFEWIDPKCPIIVRYDRAQLVLLAIRDMQTGQYMVDDEMRRLAHQFSSQRATIAVTPRLPIDLSETPTLPDLVKQIAAWRGGREGVVLRFPGDLFVKIKTKWYIDQQQVGSVGKNGSNLASIIKNHRPWIRLDDIPLRAVLVASLGNTIDEVTPLLRDSPQELKFLQDFDNGVDMGLQVLDKSLINWSMLARQATHDKRTELARNIETLVYGSSPDGSSVMPWSVETLSLYGRIDTSQTQTQKAALASMRKDLRLLASKGEAMSVAHSLNVQWPPPALSTPSASEHLYSMTEGVVCREKGIVWDTAPHFGPGRQTLMSLGKNIPHHRMAVVLRGIQGSGKSVVARALLQFTPGAVLCSADAEMKKLCHKKKHDFDKSLLQEAHEHCYSSFVRACNDSSVPLVICDNTNVRMKWMRPYLEAAKGLVQLVVIEIVCQNDSHSMACQKRNVHGVSAARYRFHQVEALDDEYLPYRVLLRPGGI